MEASIGRRVTMDMMPAAVFLFFFNTFLLPQGITFTLLLTPVWIYLLYRSDKLYLIKYLLIPIILYSIVHVWLGVDLFYYSVSVSLLLCTGIFCMAAWHYIDASAVDYEQLFKRILQLNFLLMLLSIPLLYLPFLKPLVWYTMSMSENIRVIPRLKLFTYEASHYSYLLAPVVIYYWAKAMFIHSEKVLPALFMITVPLLLSLSFGVLACLLFSGLLIIVFYFKRIFDTWQKRMLLFTALGMIVLIVLALYKYFPDNLLTMRIQNMFTGKDTSARGRTYESFILAQKIVARKSYWWGIGPGQLKLFGRDIIVQYYYYSKIPDVIRIPNASAETIICFGYIGLALRIGIQLALFYTTKVYRSPYRLWLFLFLFLFQFMGSYITNITEYVFWMLAFSPALNFFSTKTNVSRQ